MNQEIKYRQNPQGHLVPEHLIDEIDKIRDELVTQLIPEAEAAAAALREFKASAMQRVSDFAALSAVEYNAPVGGKKGNITLTSYDGSMRVIRAIDEFISFTEKMSAARELILACVAKWTEGANANLAEIVTRAFETNKEGHLSTNRILALRSYHIVDEDWSRAMDLLSQAIVVQNTNQYIRFYRRDAAGKWEQIAME